MRAIDEDLAAFGLRREGEIEGAGPVEVLPELRWALEVAIAMGTQMQVIGLGALLGYRYEALPAVLDLLGVPAAERRDVFDDLRAIEREIVRLTADRRG